jgi:cell division protein FtsI (penicillin-binding protein 3)
MRRRGKDPINLRIGIIGGLLGMWFCAICIRVVYLQAFHGQWLSERASRQYAKTIERLGKRGTIFDRNLREMAVSVDAMSIAADPEQIHDVPGTAAALARALDLDGKSLRRRLGSGRSFVWVDRKVTPRQSASVLALSLPGITFETEHQRFYPNRTLAAQVIGFAGIDGRGLEGIEFHFDQDLKGSARRCTLLQDALGRGFSPTEADAAATSGDNLILNIDRNIQYFVEQALAEAVQGSEAKSGVAIVMVPATGAILAMAHYPFFNPNAYADFPRDSWRDRAITDPFEPGSTMKIFTAAAALEHGGLTANTIFFCENGSWRIGQHILHDTHPHGWLSLQRIVQYSSNIGAAKICDRIGSKVLYRALTDFGFGEKTGIDCPGETTGCLMPYERWSDMDAGAISFGQGVSVSAIQLVTAVNAIANGGLLMKPYIVQAVTDPNGRLVRRYPPRKVRRVVSPATARTLTRILETVTQEGGTGTEAAMDDCRVAGKTGTAQKADAEGRYAPGRYIASFVGFFPAEQPVATVLVVVNEPKKEHYGGLVAAPAFHKIAVELMNYMSTEPAQPVPKFSAALDGAEVTG